MLKKLTDNKNIVVCFNFVYLWGTAKIDRPKSGDIHAL